MKILIVNDDSIHAPGIAVLAKAAMSLGEVWVVAPSHQCSAMSQKVTIRGSLTVERVKDFPVPVKAAYQVSGTPADCVKAALLQLLDEKPDFVFSGINDGYNVGYDIAYSGTLGAAFEATMSGIPAIAFSCESAAKLATAERYIEDIAKDLVTKPLERGMVWNVNFPWVEPEDVKGILRDRTIAPMPLFNGWYETAEIDANKTELLIRGIPKKAGDPVPEGTDLEAVLSGYISIGKVKCVAL